MEKLPNKKTRNAKRSYGKQNMLDIKSIYQKKYLYKTTPTQ